MGTEWVGIGRRRKRWLCTQRNFSNCKVSRPLLCKKGYAHRFNLCQQASETCAAFLEEIKFLAICFCFIVWLGFPCFHFPRVTSAFALKSFHFTQKYQSLQLWVNHSEITSVIDLNFTGVHLLMIDNTDMSFIKGKIGMGHARTVFKLMPLRPSQWSNTHLNYRWCWHAMNEVYCS